MTLFLVHWCSREYGIDDRTSYITGTDSERLKASLETQIGEDEYLWLEEIGPA